MQKAFDKHWKTGCINEEGWCANATEDGILAYKLLVQTGRIDNPVDKTLVRYFLSRSMFLICLKIYDNKLLL